MDRATGSGEQSGVMSDSKLHNPDSWLRDMFAFAGLLFLAACLGLVVWVMTMLNGCGPDPQVAVLPELAPAAPTVAAEHVVSCDCVPETECACVPPHTCRMLGEPIAWGSHGTYCPPPAEPCMMQFFDEVSGKYVSVYDAACEVR